MHTFVCQWDFDTHNSNIVLYLGFRYAIGVIFRDSEVDIGICFIHFRTKYRWVMCETIYFLPNLLLNYLQG